MRYILFFLLLSFSAQSQDWRNGYYFFNEFMSLPTTTGGGNTIYQTVSGTGAATSNPAMTNANQAGLIRSTTGTTATGRCAVTSQANCVALGSGGWSYEVDIDAISALCSDAERYALLVGFFDTYTAANQVDGVYFLYDSIGVSTSSASSDRWQCVTVSNSSRTFFTTADLVATTGAKLRIEINADGTQADFYINDVSARAATATIPTGVSRAMGFGWLLIKSAGLTARTVDIDYIEIDNNFLTTK